MEAQQIFIRTHVRQQIAALRGSVIPRWMFLILLLWGGAAPSARSQAVTTLCDFSSQNCMVGQQPIAGLVQGSDGNFYGTAILGGSGRFGTVFQITPNGIGTVLYDFCSQSGCTDGAYPYGGLVKGSDGKFYGTTYNGGAYGQGTVFSITSSGAFTTLYSFCPQGPNSLGSCEDGQNPYTAALIQGSDGNFYGTTWNGGAFGSTDTGGTVFEITPDGVLTTLYSFCSQSGCADGSNPSAALVQASDGNFYGTTLFGGSQQSNSGTVFKITPAGTLTTLHTFCPQGGPCADGQEPWAGLVVDTDGNLYGETFNSGNAPVSGGTIFKITTAGALTTLYSFCTQTGCTDGAQPRTGLALGTDGNFYGTTYYGSSSNVGTVFQVTPGGNLTTLYSFCTSTQNGCTDGAYPIGELLLATDGNFYGTTQGGGSQGTGTVFKIGFPNFSVSSTPLSETVTAGKIATYKMTITQVNGSTQTVGLTCSDLAPRSSCTISPASVALNGTSASAASVTVTTTGNSPKKATPKGTYSVTLNGNSGNLSHSTTVRLTVK